jgi:hypothetical protein
MYLVILTKCFASTLTLNLEFTRTFSILKFNQIQLRFPHNVNQLQQKLTK